MGKWKVTASDRVFGEAEIPLAYVSVLVYSPNGEELDGFVNCPVYSTAGYMAQGLIAGSTHKLHAEIATMFCRASLAANVVCSLCAFGRWAREKNGPNAWTFDITAEKEATDV